jgi:hypothetical protein
MSTSELAELQRQVVHRVVQDCEQRLSQAGRLDSPMEASAFQEQEILRYASRSLHLRESFVPCQFDDVFVLAWWRGFVCVLWTLARRDELKRVAMLVRVY